MSTTFFRTSKVWVVDYLYDGRPRRWLKAFPASVDPVARVDALLLDWYGERAKRVDVREARPDEEIAFLRGDLPVNPACRF
jgi:hypothetical protein